MTHRCSVLRSNNTGQLIWVSLVLIGLGACQLRAVSQQKGSSPSRWQQQNLPFRVLGITGIGSSLWACGVGEGLAVSSDGGAHWEVRRQTPAGGLLLNVGFANDQFGYAAGTGGLLLTTDDSGVTWTRHPAGDATILQVSFADKQHGLIRTPESLQFTADGGATWTAVLPSPEAPDELRAFPYTFSLVALDATHMAVMLKQGAAQYESQAFFVTEDAGKSWKVVNIPNATLYSFLRVQNRYWAVGTEVIHKDKPGGGYAVPVALFSSNGIQWDHSSNDLSACKMEMCVACTTSGCLSANGSIANIFLAETKVAYFLSSPKLRPTWAATNSSICFLGAQLECVDVLPATKPLSADGAVPAVVAPGPLGAKAPKGPRCVLCPLDQMLVDEKVQGAFTIQLQLQIAMDGTVTSVTTEGAPTPAIKSRVEQQVQGWIFEPYLKDRIPVNVNLKTNLQINVIKSR
jgi:hypothetical protein